MRTEIKNIHRHAVALANGLHDAAAAARVAEVTQVPMTPKQMNVLGEMLVTLMGCNKMLLEQMEAEQAVKEDYRKVAFTGTALMAHLRGCTLRQLLGWWLRQKAERSKEKRA